eukprot:13604074-Alexandrium_andersonii.AAC.1
MRRRAPASPEPRACLPLRIQAPVHVVRPRAAAQLAELIPVAPAGLAEKSARTRRSRRGP